MGQSKLRARQYGGRRIIAPAIYQDADILWIVPMALARHLRQAPLANDPEFRADAQAIVAAARLARLHNEFAFAAPDPTSVPKIGDDSLYARINPQTFQIIETLTAEQRAGLVPLVDGYRFARPKGEQIRIAVRADTSQVSSAILAGGEEVEQLDTLIAAKICTIGSITMVATDPLLLQMALLATLTHLAGGVVDGHSAHIALAAAALKPSAPILPRPRASDLWLYRLLTQREIMGSDLGVDATKPLPQLIVAVDAAIQRNADVMPDYPALRSLCSALNQPISAFRLRPFDDKREWEVYDEVVDTLSPGLQIGSPAARSELPLDRPGSSDISDRLVAHLTTLERLAERTFLGCHTASIYADGDAHFLIIAHAGESVEIVSWVTPEQTAARKSG